MYGRHSGQKGGQTSPEDAKGEQAEPLCHAVFTERLFCFLYRLLLFSRVERLPPPIITTFAPTGADLSSRFAEGPPRGFDVERHARKRSRLLLSALLAPNVAAIIRTRHEQDIRFYRALIDRKARSHSFVLFIRKMIHYQNMHET